ncbi:hypothetical protein BZA70DRAFT_245301 [Myxozyma melibiosi]|uniref:Magnesium transporter n=1 Tax=Myxozyma melibiosi TaxID=54550 RepID=A0ABR1FFW6_9ASCO
MHRRHRRPSTASSTASGRTQLSAVSESASPGSKTRQSTKKVSPDETYSTLQRPRVPMVYDSHPADLPPSVSHPPSSESIPRSRVLTESEKYVDASSASIGADATLHGSDVSGGSQSTHEPHGHAVNNASTAGTAPAATKGLRSRNLNQLLKREWADWGKKRNYKMPNTERGEIGWEPGIDVRNTVVELGEDSVVTIVDYNSDRYRIVNKIDKFSIDEFLRDEQPWSSVRWINVNGLSWEVLRSISEFYGLHPLAVEDMVDIPKRAKADHYKNQTFCTLPLHKLVSTAVVDKYFESLQKLSWVNRLLGRRKKTVESIIMNANLATVMAEQNMMTMQEWNNPSTSSEYYVMKRSLERYHEIVAVEQVSIFLIENHTIISFFENSAEEVEGPLLSRIVSASTLLREYPEPSLLLQGILDGIVDIALNIVSEYQKFISELQVEILTSPSVMHTRDLHILSEELSMLRSTLMPIYGLVQNLRDHANTNRELTLAGGYISEFAKLYLSDVADHVLAFTDNIDLMRQSTESMINLIFNTMSVQENEAMRQLTLVTIVFLPLTFLTGYFGMNFKEFGALDNTTMYFWAIAIPVTVAVIWVILYPWIGAKVARIRRYYQKKAAKRTHQQYASYVRNRKGQAYMQSEPVVGYGGSDLPIYSSGATAGIANSSQATPIAVQARSAANSVPEVAAIPGTATAPVATTHVPNSAENSEYNETPSQRETELRPIVTMGESGGPTPAEAFETIGAGLQGRQMLHAPTGVHAVKTELGLPHQAVSSNQEQPDPVLVRSKSPPPLQSSPRFYSTSSASTPSLPLKSAGASTFAASSQHSVSTAGPIYALTPIQSVPKSVAERAAYVRSRSPSPFGNNNRRRPIPQVQPPRSVAFADDGGERYSRRTEEDDDDDRESSLSMRLDL